MLEVKAWKWVQQANSKGQNAGVATLMLNKLPSTQNGLLKMKCLISAQ